jgi:hypothetical protein
MRNRLAFLIFGLAGYLEDFRKWLDRIAYELLVPEETDEDCGCEGRHHSAPVPGGSH